MGKDSCCISCKQNSKEEKRKRHKYPQVYVIDREPKCKCVFLFFLLGICVHSAIIVTSNRPFYMMITRQIKNRLSFACETSIAYQVRFGSLAQGIRNLDGLCRSVIYSYIWGILPWCVLYIDLIKDRAY